MNSCKNSKKYGNFLKDAVTVVNSHSEIKPLLKELNGLIKKFTCCESVSSMISDQDGFVSLHEHIGFTLSEFQIFTLENIRKNKQFCSVILYGNKKLLPFFSERASFYFNNKIKDINESYDDKLIEYLKFCSKLNYQSMAVIPITFKRNILGFIHVADEKSEMISPYILKILEDLVCIIGPGLYSFLLDIEKIKTDRLIQSIADDIPILINRFLPGGEIIYVNKAVCKYFGKGRNEIIGTNFLSMIPKGDREFVMSNIYSLTKDNPTQTLEHKVISKEGEIRWQRWTNRAIFDSDGNISVYQSVGEDITEHKNALEELKQSEERYRTLCETMNHGLSISNKEFEIVYINKALSQMIGHELKDITGRKQLDFVCDESKDDYIKQIHNRRKGKSGIYELNLIKKNGNKLPVMISASPMSDREGNFTGSFGVFTDLTELRHVKDALKRSEKEFKNIVELMNDGLAISDANGTLLYINPAISKMLGYNSDELLGQNQKKFVIEESIPIFEGEFANRRKGKRGRYQLTLKRKDGSKLSVMISSTPVYEKKDKSFSTIGLVTDISELKRVEDALKKSRKELETRNNIAEIFLTCQGNAMYSGVQKVLQEAMESEFSLFGYIDDDSNLVVPAYTPEVWDKCTIKEKSFKFLTHEIENTIMGRSINEKKIYMTEQLLKVPDGHVEIKNVLSAPVIYQNNTIALLMVANKKNGYNNEDKKFFENIASIISPMLFARITKNKIDKTREKTEKALTESEARYRGMFETINEGVAVYEAVDDGNDFVYADLNKAGEIIDKIKRKNVIGKKVTEMFPGIIQCGLLDAFRRVYKTGGPENLPDLFYKDNRITGWRDNFVYKLPTGEVVSVYHDTTEAKKAEEKRKTILKTVLDGFQLLDFLGNLIEVNEAMSKMSGYSKDELLSFNIADIFLFEDRKNVLDLFKNDEQEDKINFETKIRCKDGNVLDVDVTANNIKSEKGLVFVNIRDITERKKTEDRIKRLNSILFAIKDIDQLIIQGKDRDNLVQGVCESLVRTRDYFNIWIALFDEKENFLKAYTAGITKNFKSIEKLLKRGELPPCAENVRQEQNLLVIRKPHIICESCIISDGFFNMNSIIYPLFHENRKFGLIAASIPIENEIEEDEQELFIQIANDIAFAIYNMGVEEKRMVAEQDLLIKDSAIKSSKNPIVLMNLEGQVTYANPACLELWQYKEKDILGKSAISFIRPKDQTAKGLKVLKEKGSWSANLIAERKDGNHVNIHVSANMVFDIDEKPVCLMASVLDLSQQKKMEQQLIRSERLAATGQLAAFIAHEINSPLQAISIMLGTMSKKYHSDDTLLSNVKLLQNAFGSIQGTVKNLIDLNRPGLEQTQPANINNIIINSLSLMKGLLERNNIKVVRRLSKKIPPVLASPQQLSQVFMNIINNAAEAMIGYAKKSRFAGKSKKGKLILNIKTMLVNEEIQITFKDTGPGIPEKDVKYISDPFYTTKKEFGMGVGLAICFGIIQDHNGSMEVKNHKEGGAVIKISLPHI